MRAADIARQSGLRHVYAGNLPGQVGDLENTYCAECGDVLVERWGYVVRAYRLTPDGRCPQCSAVVPGKWKAPERLGGRGLPVVIRLET